MHHLHHLLRQRLQKFHFHLQPFIFGLSFWDPKLSQETEKNAHFECEEDQHFEHKLKKKHDQIMTKIFSAWSLGLWPSSLLVEFFEPSSSGFGRFQQRQRPLLAARSPGLSSNGAGDDREDNHYLGKLQVVNHSAWFSMVLRMILPCTGWWWWWWWWWSKHVEYDKSRCFFRAAKTPANSAHCT